MGKRRSSALAIWSETGATNHLRSFDPAAGNSNRVFRKDATDCAEEFMSYADDLQAVKMPDGSLQITHGSLNRVSLTGAWHPDRIGPLPFRFIVTAYHLDQGWVQAEDLMAAVHLFALTYCGSSRPVRAPVKHAAAGEVSIAVPVQINDRDERIACFRRLAIELWEGVERRCH